MIFTFYSYKGGVGRSMALANVAEWLYRRGLRVVVIDWDVEAPGLENFFFDSEEEVEHVRSQLGLIDILTSYKKRQFPRLPSPSIDKTRKSTNRDMPTVEDRVKLLQEHLPPISYALYPIRRGSEASDGTAGTLFLLPAGWRSGNRFAAYAQAVQNFGWSEMYSLYEGEAYFEWMRAQLTDDFADVVLIDSRTGVTEVGGICSRQLADVVVAFCVPNIQNLRGIETMVKSFKRRELLQARKGRPLEVVVVPTRVDASEVDAAVDFEEKFHKAALDQFAPEAFKQSRVTFWDLHLPYMAKYASSETLAVTGEDGQEDDLAAAYRKLAVNLARLAPKDSRMRTMLAADIEQLDRQPLQSEVISLLDPSAVAASEAATSQETASTVANVYYPNIVRESRRDPPFMAPPVPSPFVRHAELIKVVDKLVARRHDDLAAPIVGLHGMPGSGKTVLAAAVCRDSRVRKAFPDGILWVTPGAKPSNLSQQIEEIVMALTGERLGIANVEVATTVLTQVLRERAALLVIDDVRDLADLKPFLQVGPHCAQLITTRNSASLPSGCVSISVETMEPQEAVELLGADLPSDHKNELRTLVARLGKEILPFALPLALGLANGILQRQVSKEGAEAEVLSRTLASLGRTLDQRGSSALDARNVVEPFLGTPQALGPSLETLGEVERTRYGELSVFPEDANIPLDVVKKLWSMTGGLESTESKELCLFLAQMSLLQFDEETRIVQLHPVLRSHLVDQQGSNLTTLHRQLLEAYRPVSSTAWADLSDKEAYIWANLAYHLIEAGLVDELIATVKNVRYLSVKACVCGTLAVEQDLLAAELHRPRDQVIATLRNNFANTAHLLNQCKTPQAVAGTLHSRIAHQPVLTRIASEAKAEIPRPYITARYPLPDLPDPSLSRTLLGHQDKVRSCAISSDGSRVVSASTDSTVRLWDALRGIELTIFTEHQVPPKSCSISGDGKMVVSASEDGELKVWAPASVSELTIRANGTAPISSCAISSDKQRIISAYEDGTVRLWESSTGQLLREFTTRHMVGMRGCSISADGSVIIAASLDGTLKVWNAVTGNEINTLRGHTAGVRDCAISADGSRAVSASRDYTLKIWDVQSGIETSTLTGHEAGVNGCAISSDGSVIVSAGRDGMLKVWDVDTGREVKTLSGHSGWVEDCAISADGVVIVSASDDNTLKIWNADREVFRPNVSQYETEMNDLSVSADGALVACASSDGTTTLWDAHSGSMIHKFLKDGHSAPVLGCAIASAERVAVSASRDTTLKVWSWDTETYYLRYTLKGHDAAVRSCAVSTDKHIIVSGSTDRTLRLWDLSAATIIKELVGHRASVLACKISPDGSKIISSSQDHTLRVWDAANGTILRTLYGHKGWVLDCAINPDGDIVVSASADHTLKVWDITSGVERLTLRGHSAGVFGCAISPDGSRIASASGDNTLRVWDSLDGNCLTTLHVDGRLSACAWSSDRDITAVGSRGVYFLQLIPRTEQGTGVRG